MLLCFLVLHHHDGIDSVQGKSVIRVMGKDCRKHSVADGRAKEGQCYPGTHTIGAKKHITNCVIRTRCDLKTAFVWRRGAALSATQSKRIFANTRRRSLILILKGRKSRKVVCMRARSIKRKTRSRWAARFMVTRCG